MILSDLMIANPRTSVVLVAFLVSLFMVLISKHFTDQKRMKELKDIQKSSQAKLKEHKDDAEKQLKIQQEMMESSFELLRHSFKPMLISLAPILILFWWIKGVYAETVIASSWLWWYIISAIVSSLVLRKVLDVV